MSASSIYKVASKSSWKSLVKFTGVANVNEEMYIDILHRLRDAIRRKCPEKWRNNRRFLRHKSAPVHQSVLVKDLLAKNGVTTLEHPPKSPVLAPADFYLFPHLKSVLKGWHFCDATDLIKTEREELKRLS